MFDIGFSELMILAVVALIVIGPERLPKVARTAGHLLGRLQRYVSDVKADINREMQLEELRSLQHDVQESARELEGSIRKEANAVEGSLNEAVASLETPASELAPASGEEAGAAAAEHASATPNPDQLELSLESQVPKKAS